MTVGELFAGIGGIGLGLERAGMEVKWAIEYDPYAAAVYRKNFPHIKMIEQDITTIDFTELEYVDMLTGGFPCQDISYAGKGAGIEGSRSGLWKEFWRAIRDVRPRLVLVENVPALLSRGLGVVLGDLASIGYDAEWDCIPAEFIGALHRRDRWFCLAYPYGTRELQPQGIEQDEWGRPCNGSEEVADADKSRLAIRLQSENGRGDLRKEGQTTTEGGWWSVEPDVGRVADGIPSRVDRLRCLGSAVVPQVAEWIGRRILEVYELD